MNYLLNFNQNNFSTQIENNKELQVLEANATYWDEFEHGKYNYIQKLNLTGKTNYEIRNKTEIPELILAENKTILANSAKALQANQKWNLIG